MLLVGGISRTPLCCREDMSDRSTGDEMSLVRCSESGLVWFYQLLIVVVVSVK